MSAGRAGALLMTAASLSGCGTTFVEVDDPVRPPTSSVVATEESNSARSPSPDDPTDVLLDSIENLLRGLDQEIIDDEAAAAATLDQIEAAWAIAEPRIAESDAPALFNFGQAIELARSGVERRRPADASKGLKIFGDVADAYFGR